MRHCTRTPIRFGSTDNELASKVCDRIPRTALAKDKSNPDATLNCPGKSQKSLCIQRLASENALPSKSEAPIKWRPADIRRMRDAHPDVNSFGAWLAGDIDS